MAEETIEDYKKRVSVLEKKLAWYENDAVLKGYHALKRTVNQQVDALNAFELHVEISSNPKEDKKYDRIKSIWSELKGLITDLNSLELELGIKSVKEEEEKKGPIMERFAEIRK